MNIQGRSRISHVFNGGRESQYCICGKYDEPIHIKGQFTILIGRKTHHEVFERHF